MVAIKLLFIFHRSDVPILIKHANMYDTLKIVSFVSFKSYDENLLILLNNVDDKISFFKINQGVI